MVEGTAQYSFLAYFSQNEQYFKEVLSRAQFLRLKFSPISEVRKILNEAQILYCWNESAIKMESYFLNFHKDVLNECGRLEQTHKTALSNGAIGCFLEKKLDLADSLLRSYLGIQKKTKNYNLEKFQDAMSFGSIELDFGLAVLFCVCWMI